MEAAKPPIKNRRVLFIHWKNKPNDPFQVFSNLKNFCASYPQYSYNTLNNYLSKKKKPYENTLIRIERKEILTKVIKDKAEQPQRSIAPIVKKGRLIDINQDEADLTYWLSKPVHDRAAAVTYLALQLLEPGQRMDKTYVKKRKLKSYDSGAGF